MQNQAAMLLAFAKLKGDKLSKERLALITRIDPDALITEISNEYDLDQREKSRRKGEKRGKSSSGVKDEATMVNGKGKERRKFDPARPIGLCRNCYQADHQRGDCKNPAATPPTESEARSRLAKAKSARGKGKERAAANAVSVVVDGDGDSTDGTWSACFVRETPRTP